MLGRPTYQKAVVHDKCGHASSMGIGMAMLVGQSVRPPLQCRLKYTTITITTTRWITMTCTNIQSLILMIPKRFVNMVSVIFKKFVQWESKENFRQNAQRLSLVFNFVS